MIYTKKANFPYPVLMNFTDDYINPEFDLDVMLRADQDNYILEITWEINSDFIKSLLADGRAVLVLIIKSKDNQYHFLDYVEKPKISISKTRLSLNERTVMQLMIQTKEEISFAANDDLNAYYDDMKSGIMIPAGKALGFSGTVILDGSQKKPYELFEKKVDRTIQSDVEIRLSDETIVIVYKDEELQFADIQNSRELNYPYLYMGLQKALIAFILHENPASPEEGLSIYEMDPPQNALDGKLYNLMVAKGIAELNINNIDETIYRMSDNLVSRYADVVRGLHSGN